MMKRPLTNTLELIMRTWADRLNKAASSIDARWSMRAIRNYNPTWAKEFEALLVRFDNAMDSGSSEDIETTGRRLSAAYSAISAHMAAAEVPDDAYQIGRDPDTGLTIAIGSNAVRDRVRETTPGAVWYSPDEIAVLLSLDARAKKVTAVKQAFPGAEMGEIKTR